MRAAARWLGVWAVAAMAAACGGGGDSGGGGPDPNPGTREWTVMVYMAADNNLAVQGILDLDEMEDAGVTGAVSVVTQAEYNPDALAQYQCDASCFGRPNFNTFRYAITQGGGSATNGPDRGPVTDIGNVDMTSPQTLGNFITWAKTNYPANHYLLVLWNHGGGYAGLLQDQTTAGSGLMTMDQLKAGLAAGGGVDVVDFDMCLMGAYETLLKLVGLADYAVFSEETVPGEGNPYTSIIDALQANPTMDGRALASMLVDKFHQSFANNKASTTKSAYEVVGVANLDLALTTLATDLTAQLTTGLGPTIATAASEGQKYTFSELTDLVTFLDSLESQTNDPALHTKIQGVRDAALATNFRIISRARNGSGSGAEGASDVSRSTGLHIVLPSGIGADRFNATGPQSLAAYQALYPGKAWTTFLTAFATGNNGGGTNATFDQGDQSRFESYLVWEQGAISAGADVDFWVLEPDGNIYIPALGSVSPNGTLTNDSWNDGVNFEGYLTNRVVMSGTYKIYANLWRDPQNFQPVYDLAWRQDQDGNFALLFGQGNQPLLSTQVSWLDDADPTLGEVENGDYTDLQYVGFAQLPAPAQGNARAGHVRPLPVSVSTLRKRGPEITKAQVATIRRLMAARAEAGVAGRSAPVIGKPMSFGGRH